MNRSSNNRDISGWAKALALIASLVFLVIDTTNLAKDADIIGVLVLDITGKELYRSVVKPLRNHEPNTQYTGLTRAELDQAATLAEQWPALQDVLRGKLVAAYGFDWVQARLHENAQYQRLEPLYLVGECLHELACQYCHRSSGVKLSVALNAVGYPTVTLVKAADRARAQITLLKAIGNDEPKRAAPVLGARRPIEVLGDAAQHQQDLDDHPF